MQIKEVEKLTGLSTKAIRLYEEKGLITVGRNQSNAYRDYSEENVQQLRLIRLLRYFDFSISEIKALLPFSEEKLQQVMLNKKTFFVNQKEMVERKSRLLDQVIAEIGVRKEWVEEAQESISFVESEEFHRLKEALDFALLPSFWHTLLLTLGLFSPIFWLFIRIGQKRYEDISFLLMIAFGVTLLLTLIWRSYVVTWWRRREVVQKKNNSHLIWLLICVVSMITGIAYIVLVDFLIRSLLPSQWLFYEYSSNFGKMTIVLVELTVGLILAKLVMGWKIAWKSILFLLGSTIMATAFSISNTTVVTENQVIQFNLLGSSKVYSYEDIDAIQTGFGTKLFALDETEKKGQFSYKIIMDHTEISFAQPQVNHQLIADDTYIELEEFDQRLVELGIEKESSKEGSQYSDLDPHYIERFLRIVNNK
ncbi:MerR family transcriptional regulator [Streptococcus suis]|nr:MerR family transcriptional regulator [Streptococcus suis]